MLVRFGAHRPGVTMIRMSGGLYAQFVGLAPRLILAATLAAGCAPSLRAVHRSNAYFELCHGADYDALRTPDERGACWRAWLDHYQVGQSPDRIRYAERRLHAASQGLPAEPLPGLQSAAASGAQTPAYLSRALDGTRAPPPPAPRGGAVPPPRRSPPSAYGPCASVCGPRWGSCIDECEGRDASCGGACEAEHRTCMRGCY